MNEKKKGLLHILLVFAGIALLTVVAVIGVGSQHKGSAKNIRLGLDLAGGVSITYETVKDNPTQKEMSDTIYRIQKRVDNIDTEAAVYQEGKNRINVDIPGANDANSILKQLGEVGSIEFVDENNKVVIDGKDISTAEAGTFQGNVGNEYIVELTLNESGAKKFAEATQKNIGKRISIVYNGEVVSSPVVNEPITGGKAQISGQSSFKEAENLASTIRIGALPLELRELRSNVVGAKLGEEALDSSLIAGVIGIILVMLFMIFMYRIPGLAASIGLLLYTVLTLVVYNGFNITLTLPGIAGTILSIGMAVDANVIIFARIKEELATGKSVLSSFKLGFGKAMSAIMDGNITCFIVAMVLWVKGSGTVKGFAQTLALGVVMSVFTALFVTKFILYALYKLGFDDVKYYGVQKPLKTKNIIKNRFKFFAFSGALMIIGIVALVVNKNNGSAFEFALDFVGGTSTEVTFNETKIDSDLKTDLTALVSDITKDANVELSTVEDTNTMLIRTKELSLDQRTELTKKLESDYGIKPEDIKMESISGTVSNEMKKDAVISLLIAMACMLLYIWIRFKDIKYGISAIIALCHDILILLMVYAVTRIPIGNTFIACLLTIVGYSINSTIVTYDRVRENMATMNKNDTVEQVVNDSITQTISRNINSNFTSFMTIFVLFLLGVDSIKEFTLPMMIGIACGVYTSICITATIWYMFTKKVKVKAKKAA